jgi:HrpA-like RNA helicase
VAQDAEINGLYQLPLEEFTAARNALAKDVAKSSKAEADEIRRLVKPPLAAWAINQVYWKARPAYHALAASANALKAAHAAVLSGKHADLRAAGKAHEDALDAVLKTALTLVGQSGGTVTDATKQAIMTTLHGLAASTDPPGRLSKTLQPGGFELLAGLPTGSALSRAAAASAPATPPAARAKEPAKGTKDTRQTKAIAKAKDTLASATRAERLAEQAAKRDEFEAARFTRDHERATQQLAAAKEALEAAQDAHEKAESNLETIARKKDVAVRRARESGTALASARVRTESARADLAELEER